MLYSLSTFKDELCAGLKALSSVARGFSCKRETPPLNEIIFASSSMVVFSDVPTL